MQWQLPTTHHPAYLRMIQLITHSIEIVALLPGERLPSERTLATKLGVNRSTVQRALADLVSQGLLDRHVGSGTWVSTDKWGVAQSTHWHDYLSANRLLGPDPFVNRLTKAREQPGVLNLADSTIDQQLAIPLVPSTLSIPKLYAQEQHVDITGSLALKRVLTDVLRPELGPTLSSDQLLLTSGAQQAFYLISQGLLHQGDAIAVEAPSYFYQLTLFQAAGIRIYGVPLRHGELDLDALTALYHQHHVRFLFVNPTGQNPTGATMSLSMRTKLLSHCRGLHLPIVEDDLLGITTALGNPTPPPLHQLDPHNVLAIGSLSPLMGAHTRVGWLVAPPPIVQRLAQIRQQMEAELSIFPQQIATELLTQPNLVTAVAHQQATLAVRKQALASALQPFVAKGQLDYAPGNDNYHFWCHIHVDRHLLVPDYDHFLTNGLLVRPGFLFGEHGDYVRLSYAKLAVHQAPLVTSRLQHVFADLLKN